jgi:hypothetical protein
MGFTGTERAPTPEYPPGTRVPMSGVYEQRSVLGSSTGERITVARGEALPAAPRGFTWRLLEAIEGDRTPDQNTVNMGVA